MYETALEASEFLRLAKNFVTFQLGLTLKGTMTENDRVSKP
jgi:hypothetical protein